MKKRIIFISLMLTIAFFLALQAVTYFAKRKINEELSNFNPEYASLDYKNVELSILKRNISLHKVIYRDSAFGTLTISKISLSQISIWKFLNTSSIDAGNLSIEKPNLIFNNKKYSSNPKSNSNSKISQIKIAEIEIEDGYLYRKGRNLSESDLEITKIDGRILNFQIDSATIKEKIPFHFKDYDLIFENGRIPISSYHAFTVKEFKAQPQSFEIKEVEIKPLVNRKEFHKFITNEKDYIQLKGKSIKIGEPSFKNQQDSIGFYSNYILLDSIRLNVYRDKRIKDDESYKPMYSQLLREIKLPFLVDSLKVVNSSIEYTEQPDSDMRAGKLVFSELSLESNTLSNIKEHSEVNIAIQCLFNDQARMNLTWNFDVLNKQDQFKVQGKVKNIEGTSMNSFLSPVANVKASGKIDQLFFDFYGNRREANGEMQLSYKDFDLEIYNDKTKKVRKLLTSIANWIIEDKKDKGLVKEDDIQVERDITKSFWNYLWQCIQKGLIKIAI